MQKLEIKDKTGRCGMVWCGMVWYGVVWCGVVYCGVVWYGVVSALQELEIKDKILRYKLDTAAPV